MISIITATLNAEMHLPNLIQSLKNQTDKNFIWLIADGGSTDRTIEILESADIPSVKILYGPDFGIYDGLNKLIKIIDTEYYITVGADDLLDLCAVQNYNKAIEKIKSDFITSKVLTSEGVLLPHFGSRLRYGHQAYISQHAVGTLIRKDLHKSVGLYSNKFPIAADRHFILKSIEKHNSSTTFVDFISGTYSLRGVSSTERFNAMLDIFKVDYTLSNRKFLTLILILFKYITNMHSFL